MPSQVPERQGSSASIRFPLPDRVASVRRATQEDLAGMAAVNALTGRPPLNVAALETAVGDPRRLFLVATGDEGMVGWAKTHCWDRPDGAAPAGHYLGGVVVAPAARRRGLATALTQARMDWIWEHCREAFYVVNASNLPSIELHRRWGFSEVARASAFHTTSFTGGVGLLMRAVLPEP